VQHGDPLIIDMQIRTMDNDDVASGCIKVLWHYFSSVLSSSHPGEGRDDGL
jgi:hypothetical protein